MSVPAGPQPTQPGAVEVAGWTSRRNAARQRYSEAMAQNAFSQAEVGRNYQTDVANQQRAQGRARSTFGDSYASRGLLNSGLYGRGLRNFYLDMAQQQQGMANQYQSALGGLQLGAVNAEGGLAEQLGSIDAEETARRADLAAEIRGVL